MNRLTLAGCAAVLLFVVAPAPLPGQDQAERESPHNGDVQGVGVRYAEANLRLAEVELRIALVGNEKLPNIYSAQTIQRLRNNVAYAQGALRHEARGDDGIHELHLRDVEGALKLAELDLATAVAANKQVPGAVNDLEVARLRAIVDVAHLALEKARDPAAAQSPMEHVQWQLDRLRFELTRLYVQMDKVASHN